MRHFKVKDSVYIALMAAVISVTAQIVVLLPSGIPVTLATFSIALCAYIFGSRRASAGVLVYIALGAIGLPVFAGFAGGIGTIVSITGGFIAGYIPFAAICGLCPKGNAIMRILLGIAGIFACHLLGVLQVALISARGIVESFIVASLPYIIKDIICVISAYSLSHPLRRIAK